MAINLHKKLRSYGVVLAILEVFFIFAFSTSICFTSETKAWYRRFQTLNQLWKNRMSQEEIFPLVNFSGTLLKRFDGAVVAWRDSYILGAYLTAFKATEKQEFADNFIRLLEDLLSNTSVQGGILGWPTSRHSKNLVPGEGECCMFSGFPKRQSGKTYVLPLPPLCEWKLNKTGAEEAIVRRPNKIIMETFPEYGWVRLEHSVRLEVGDYAFTVKDADAEGVGLRVEVIDFSSRGVLSRIDFAEKGTKTIFFSVDKPGLKVLRIGHDNYKAHDAFITASNVRLEPVNMRTGITNGSFSVKCDEQQRPSIEDCEGNERVPAGGCYYVLPNSGHLKYRFVTSNISYDFSFSYATEDEGSFVKIGEGSNEYKTIELHPTAGKWKQKTAHLKPQENKLEVEFIVSDGGTILLDDISLRELEISPLATTLVFANLSEFLAFAKNSGNTRLVQAILPHFENLRSYVLSYYSVRFRKGSSGSYLCKTSNGKSLPYNASLTLGRALIYDYKRLSLEWKSRLNELYETFKNNLRRVGNRFVWNYRDRLAEADDFRVRLEDINHANLDMEFVRAANEQGYFFSADELKCFAQSVFSITSEGPAIAVDVSGFGVRNSISSRRNLGGWIGVMPMCSEALTKIESIYEYDWSQLVSCHLRRFPRDIGPIMLSVARLAAHELARKK